MTEPKWLAEQLVRLIHAQQMREHGGAPGVRDAGMLDSALSRARNAFAYGEADLFRLAASYGYGIARNHPFVDGNKRTAFLTMFVFLQVNGIDFTAEETDVVRTILELAEGTLSEDALATWLSENSNPT